MTEIEERVAAVLLQYWPENLAADREKFGAVFAGIGREELARIHGKLIPAGKITECLKITTEGKKMFLNLVKGF